MPAHPPSPQQRGNVFSSRCRARVVLDLLAEKWALLAIHSLAESPKRTAELKRHIDGVSDKMLIQTLRRLERYGFVARQAFAEVPPRVEYRLTPLGAKLSGLICALDGWMEEHVADIAAAQLAFDTARSKASGQPASTTPSEPNSRA